MAIYGRCRALEDVTTTQLEELSGCVIHQVQIEALAMEEATDTTPVRSYIQPEHLWVFGPR